MRGLTRAAPSTATLVVAAWLAAAAAQGVGLDRPEVDEARLAEHLEALRRQAQEDFRQVQQRIQDVSFRLVTRGAPICGEAVAPVLAASIARRNDFVPHARKEQVEAAFGVGDRVRVFAVAKDSPAERAGLLAGDEILAVDDRRVDRTKHVYDRLRKSQKGDPVFRVLRGGTVLELSLPRQTGCDVGIRIRVSPGIDTEPHKNRSDLWVPTGLGDFARDDDELAIAIAHQIGHHLVGSFRSARKEPEADRLGLYLAARAGFDVSGAPAFWDRVAAEEPWKIPADAGRRHVPHGALALRLPVIRRTVAEIQALRAAGKPIDIPPGPLSSRMEAFRLASGGSPRT